MEKNVDGSSAGIHTVAALRPLHTFHWCTSCPPGDFSSAGTYSASGLSISLQKLFIHENNACLPLCVTKTRKCTAVLKFFFFSTKNGGNFVAEANPPFAVKGASPTYPSFANNVE